MNAHLAFNGDAQFMSDTRSKEYRQKFADRVHYARTEAGYTQTQISKLLGIRQTTYSNYEGRGTALPPSCLPTCYVNSAR